MGTKNKDWLRIGSIKKSDKGHQYLTLGTEKAKFKPFTVELIVKDATGKVLAHVTNPNLNVQNPRKRPGISEEDANKIPSFLMADVSLPPAKE